MKVNDIYSNAFNFGSYINTGVDPRTGQYSANINIITLRPNNVGNVEQVLNLSFSPLTTLNNGFGIGWRFSLTTLDVKTLTFSRANGEQFKCKPLPPNNNDISFKDKKLKDLRVYKLDSNTFYVYNKNGIIETLKRIGSSDIAKTVALEFPDGEAFDLIYNSRFALSEIKYRVTGKTYLKLNYSGNNCTSVEYPDDNNISAKIAFDYRNDYLITVTVPYDASGPIDSARFKMTYQTLKGIFPVISAFRTPTGYVELVSYKENGHKVTDSESIPYAAALIIQPGNGQPAISKSYEYSSVHNFLGYSSGRTSFDSSQDNLYLVTGKYTYSSIERVLDGQNVISVTERVFNKFHLMTKEARTQDNKRITTEITYNEDPSKSFSEQPENLQQPSRVLTRYTDLQTNTSREETVNIKSDDWGNTLLITETSGIQKEYVYYPVNGEGNNCPADPLGFSRFLKSAMQKGSPDAAQSVANRVTNYTYQKLPTFTGAYIKEYVSKASETIDSKIVRTFSYVNSPTNKSHGSLAKITSVMNNQQTVTTFKYEYSENEMTTNSTVTGFDGAHMESKNVTSIYTHRQLRKVDVNRVITDQSYDLLGRITGQIIDPGTTKEVKRNYVYQYPGGDENDFWPVMIEIDSQGVRRKTHYDGQGRICSIEEQDDDSTWGTSGIYQGTYRKVLARQYDVLGQLIKEISNDWLWDLSANPLTRLTTPLVTTKTYQYDGWGNRYSTEYSDGRIELEIHDPITRTIIQGVKGLGMLNIQQNSFEQPASIKVVYPDGVIYSTRTYRYDGFGRTVTETDAEGYATQIEYDVFDRIVKKTLPDRTILESAYASFSHEELISALNVNGTQLGSLVYDGLGRVTSDTVGGRKTEYLYGPQGDKPIQSVTPAHNKQNIDYLYSLGSVMSKFTTETSQQNFRYHPKTGALLSASEGVSQSNYSYFPSGVLQHESFSRDNKPVSSGDYRYTMSGLIQRHRDSFAHDHVYSYDGQGRLVKTEQGSQYATFEYDNVGRLITTTTKDATSLSQLVTKIEYDVFDREIKRSLISDFSIQVMTLSYTKNNQISQRITSVDGVVMKNERYQYDSNQRLSQYQCEGEQSPVDHTGRVLNQQIYHYDQWGNIKRIDNTYRDGKETVDYHFSQTDPTQLIRITSDKQQIELSYDANGNLTRDEKGQTLIYDQNNRLVQVKDSKGNLVCQYQYDALNKLTAQVLANGTMNRQYYASGKVTNVQLGDETITWLNSDKQRLGHQSTKNGQSVYYQYGTDHNSTVVASQNENELMALSYTPYGFRSLISSLPGLNGAQIDPVTGWYFLGNGYRVFNPVLMRFHSPDSWSPFGRGGVNPYTYCQGDPINRIDLNGHLSAGGILGIVLGAIGIIVGIVSLGAGAAISAGLIAAGGALGAIASTSTLAVTATVIGLAADSIGIASAALSEKDPKTAGILNWISAGLGVLSFGISAITFTSSLVKSARSGSQAVSTGVIGSVPIEFGEIASRSSRRWDIALSTVSLSANAVALSTGIAASAVADSNANAANILGWVSVGFGAVSTTSGLINLARTVYAVNHHTWELSSSAGASEGSEAYTLSRFTQLEPEAVNVHPSIRAVEVNQAFRNSTGNLFSQSSVETRNVLRGRLTI
ncbi:hypothetical protein C6H64_18740 [Photorhabdus luminescens]|nr:hypothetical protein C6H64_18740 [Photorhabdus luminescens]